MSESRNAVGPTCYYHTAYTHFVVSFIASGYPSAIMAKLKTVEVLKGK
jgi:ABC-type lipoprotein release transport system permease subunit